VHTPCKKGEINMDYVTHNGTRYPVTYIDYEDKWCCIIFGDGFDRVMDAMHIECDPIHRAINFVRRHVPALSAILDTLDYHFHGNCGLDEIVDQICGDLTDQSTMTEE